MSRKKKKAKKQDFIMSDVDKMFRHIGNKFNLSLFLNRMSDAERERFREAWRKAKPKQYDDLTEAEKKAYDKSQAKMYRAQKKARPYRQMRELLQIGIIYKSDDPDSELFQTAKELLDFVDRAEIDPSSVSWLEHRKFLTGFDRYIVLLNAESEAEHKAIFSPKTTKKKKVKTKEKKKRIRPKQIEMQNRNKAVAMAAAKFQTKHDRLPTVDEIITETKYSRQQIYATEPYKEDKIAKRTAKASTEMTGGSVQEGEYYSDKSEKHGRIKKRSKAEEAELDALIDEQEKDDGSYFVMK